MFPSSFWKLVHILRPIMEGTQQDQNGKVQHGMESSQHHNDYLWGYVILLEEELQGITQRYILYSNC